MCAIAFAFWRVKTSTNEVYIPSYCYRWLPEKADDGWPDGLARLGLDVCVSIPRVQINSIKFAAAQVLNVI